MRACLSLHDSLLMLPGSASEGPGGVGAGVCQGAELTVLNSDFNLDYKSRTYVSMGKLSGQEFSMLIRDCTICQ